MTKIREFELGYETCKQQFAELPREKGWVVKDEAGNVSFHRDEPKKTTWRDGRHGWTSLYYYEFGHEMTQRFADLKYEDGPQKVELVIVPRK